MQSLVTVMLKLLNTVNLSNSLSPTQKCQAKTQFIRKHFFASTEKKLKSLDTVCIFFVLKKLGKPFNRTIICADNRLVCLHVFAFNQIFMHQLNVYCQTLIHTIQFGLRTHCHFERYRQEPHLIASKLDYSKIISSHENRGFIPFSLYVSLNLAGPFPLTFHCVSLSHFLSNVVAINATTTANWANALISL